jgi:UDP-N-acetylmuramoylalanine--D-glutamate ligase
VIGITGSSGKTTTTTLVGRIAAAGHESEVKVWVGGNIGLPLIDHLEEIHPQDLVVLELSSFQLEQMTHSPQIAAVLNVTPNHLDRHGTFRSLYSSQSPPGGIPAAG